MQACCDIKMIRSQMPLTDGERHLVKRLGLFIFAFFCAEFGYVIEDLSCVRVLESYDSFAKRTCTPLVRLSLVVCALVEGDLCKGIEAGCYVRVIWSQHTFPQSECALMERLGLCILVLIGVNHRQMIEAMCYHGMISPQSCSQMGSVHWWYSSVCSYLPWYQ